MNPDVPIGEASKASGVKIPTIRYYEQIGLLPAPPRTEGNRRLYDKKDIQRLLFIRHARDLGFEIDAIRTLLDLQDNPDQSCAVADAVARARLIDVENRIARLLSLKTELQRMLDCTAHGRIDQCRVIEILGNHEECIHPSH
jgi:DNA-binding transcriptional MerR regulator